MGEYDVVRGGTMPLTPPVRYRGSPASMSTVVRPKIKIIHIIAPEIIKTDAANFRDLVQRLTGKQQQPADGAVTVRAARLPPVEEEQKEEQQEAIKKRPALAAAGDFTAQQENSRRKKIKCEVVKVEEGAGFGGGGGGGGGDLDHGELWMDLNPGGFLSFLEEEVFLAMAADPDFLQPLGSSRMDFVGEMCASYLA